MLNKFAKQTSHSRALPAAAALLAALCLAGCGGSSPSPSATAAPSASAGSSQAASSAPSTAVLPENTQTTLNITTEGETVTVAAVRHQSPLGFILTYPQQGFVADPDEGTGFILRSEPAAFGMECGLSVTVYDEEAAVITEELLAEYAIDEADTAVIGAGGYEATRLLGSTGVGEDDLQLEYYVARHSGRTYKVLLYYPPDLAEGAAAWLHAMLKTLEFTA